MHLWLLKLCTWLKNSVRLENVNYSNPCYDWTDSCWSYVDCQGVTFTIIQWYCSFSTSKHFIPHQFFSPLIRSGCIDFWVEVEDEHELNKELSDIFVFLQESLPSFRLLSPGYYSYGGGINVFLWLAVKRCAWGKNHRRLHPHHNVLFGFIKAQVFLLGHNSGSLYNWLTDWLTGYVTN